MESKGPDRIELMCREAESMCIIILDSLYDDYKPYDADSCDDCEPHPALADIIFGGLDNAYPIRFDSRAYFRDNPDGKPFDAVLSYMTSLARDEDGRKKMAAYVEFAWRKYNLAFRAYMVELGMYAFFKENLYCEDVTIGPDGDVWDALVVSEPDFRTERESHECEAFSNITHNLFPFPEDDAIDRRFIGRALDVWNNHAFWFRMWRYELKALADMDEEFKDTYFEIENCAASELFRLLDLWKIQNSGI